MVNASAKLGWFLLYYRVLVFDYFLLQGGRYFWLFRRTFDLVQIFMYGLVRVPLCRYFHK